MKVIRNILTAAFAFSALACVPVEADLFPESSAQRMNEAVAKYSKALEAADYWAMDFYPSHDGQMGGVVFVGSFKDGVAGLYCELADVTEVAKSLYQVKGEQECLLTFDTYNPFMHYFSEPDGDSVTGMESDYEFAFKDMSEDGKIITLKGKRYGQPLILRKLDSDTDPSDYLTKILEIEDLFNAMPRMTAVIDEEEFDDVVLAEGIFSYDEMIVEGEDTTFVTNSVPYITTLEGIHMQKPVTYRGQTFQDCTYNTEDQSIMAVGSKVTFPYKLPAGYRTYEELAGSYTALDGDGAKLNITVTTAGENEYNIAGLAVEASYGLNFTIKASYNSTWGSIEIAPQYCGMLYSQYYVWLMTMDDSYLYNTPTVGRNDEDGNITFGAGGTPYSVCLYAYTDANRTNSAGGVMFAAEPLVFTRVK